MVSLYSKFENLSEEKKRRIIDVCLEEFSENGYQNASTNNIVKNAEISKGILFHYFGSKKQLYLYLMDYAMDSLAEKMKADMTDLPADFFERVIKIGIIKLKAAYKYPVEYKFLLNAVLHAPDELKQDVQARYEKAYKANVPMLFDDLDTSKFRRGMDKCKAMELIMFVSDGFSSKYLKLMGSMTIDEVMSRLEQITEEFNEYIEILKYGIYEKSEGQ